MAHRKSGTVLITIGLVVFLCGCQTGQSTGNGQSTVERARLRISEPELQQELLEFGDRFKAAVRAGAGQIEDATRDRTIGRRTLIWKSRMTASARELLAQSDPREGLLDVYALCMQQKLYFTDGEGKDLFGEYQTIAIEAADEILEDVDRLLHRVLTDQQVQQMRQVLQEFARANPIRSMFRMPTERPSQLAMRRQENGFSALMDVPLAPFRAISGVDRTAVAVQDFTKVAGRFANTVEDIPEQTRWQTELLAYNLEDRETLVQTRESLAALSRAANSMAETLPEINKSAGAFAETSQRFADTANDLPKRLREEADALLGDIDERQKNLQQTVSDVRQTVQDIDRTMARTNEVAQSVEKTSAGIAEAGKAWQGTVQTFGDVAERIRGEPATAQPASDGREFDIEHYTAAAREMTQLAVEMQKVLTELERADAFVANVEGSSKTTIETATANLNGSIRFATINVFLLIIGAAVVMLLYRVIVTRWLSPRETEKQ